MFATFPAELFVSKGLSSAVRAIQQELGPTLGAKFSLFGNFSLALWTIHFYAATLGSDFGKGHRDRCSFPVLCESVQP